MHEITLLYHVADRVKAVADENGLDHIDAVVLQIGELSAVIPHYMREYYPMLAEDYPLLKDSELLIETIPGVGACRGCGKEFNIAENSGACPDCGSREKELLSGTEFFIKEIRVAES